MKLGNLLFAFNFVQSRSIFPKPRPTTLGYHPDHPSILIPVPLFPLGLVTIEDTAVDTSTENIPEPTTTFESTTQQLTTEYRSFENDLTTTTSTGAQFYTTLYEELSEPLTATIPFPEETPISTTILPVTLEERTPEVSTVTTLVASTPENDGDKDIGLRDGFIGAWEMAKELGSMVIGGVGAMFSKISSYFN